MDAGHVDAVGPQLGGEISGERHHAGVADAADDGAATPCRQARDVDDATPTATPHERGCLPRAAQVAQHLHVQRLLELVGGQVVQPRVGRQPRHRGCAVDQDVDAAQLLRGAPHQCPYRGIVSSIRRHRYDPAVARGSTQLRRRLLQRLAPARGDRHRHPGRCQLRRHRPSDAAAAPGHHRRPSLQFQIHPASSGVRAAGPRSS